MAGNEICDDQVGMLGANLHECFGAVRRFGKLIAAVTEQGHQKLTVERSVIEQLGF